jgi:hypothetical protein
MSEVKRELLTAEEIFAAEDIETVDVEVPEWKGKDGKPGIVRLRTLSGEEASKFVQTDQQNGAVRVLFLSAVKEDGTPLFEDEASLEKLRRKSLKAIVRLQKEALRINGLSPEAEAATKKD